MPLSKVKVRIRKLGVLWPRSSCGLRTFWSLLFVLSPIPLPPPPPPAGPCLRCSPASQGPVCPWTQLPRGPQQRELPDAQARPAGSRGVGELGSGLHLPWVRRLRGRGGKLCSRWTTGHRASSHSIPRLAGTQSLRGRERPAGPALLCRHRRKLIYVGQFTYAILLR